MSTNLHSWPVHLRQCLLLWSFRPPPHQSASPQGLSSHGAAQQHWCIHCHPEKKFLSVNWLLDMHVCACGSTDSVYLVKDTECFSDLLLTVCVLHLPGHHGQELWEVYRSISWRQNRHGLRISNQHINRKCVVNKFKSQIEFSPSASTSLIMSCSSASVGFWPRERMTVPSSLVVMVPSPSLSKSENASLNSGCGEREVGERL